jgi:hypothetical protein
VPGEGEVEPFAFASEAKTCAVVAKFLGCSTSRVRDKLRSMGKVELKAAFAGFD